LNACPYTKAKGEEAQVGYLKIVQFDHEYKGWCVGEDHRESINGNLQFSSGVTANTLTYRYCKEDCGAARWNGQEPTACEWSVTKKTCNAFWGGNVDASRSGTNYECYLVNKPKAETGVAGGRAAASSTVATLLLFKAKHSCWSWRHSISQKR